jgi:hypothetical protein
LQARERYRKRDFGSCGVFAEHKGDKERHIRTPPVIKIEKIAKLLYSAGGMHTMVGLDFVER